MKESGDFPLHLATVYNLHIETPVSEQAFHLGFSLAIYLVSLSFVHLYPEQLQKMCTCPPDK